LAAVASKYKDLQELGVELLSISVDSHFEHKMWQDNELSKMVDGGVPFPMLSESDAEFAENSHLWMGTNYSSGSALAIFLPSS